MPGTWLDDLGFDLDRHCKIEFAATKEKIAWAVMFLRRQTCRAHKAKDGLGKKMTAAIYG